MYELRNIKCVIELDKISPKLLSKFEQRKQNNILRLKQTIVLTIYRSSSDMKLSFIQHCIHKKEFRMKTPASALYPWYQNFFSGDESMCLESMDEKKWNCSLSKKLFMIQVYKPLNGKKKSAKNILRKCTIRFLGNLERNLLMLTEMIYTGEFNTKITSWTADGCAFREKVIFNGKTLPSKRLCL